MRLVLNFKSFLKEKYFYYEFYFDDLKSRLTLTISLKSNDCVFLKEVSMWLLLEEMFLCLFFIICLKVSFIQIFLLFE